MNNNGYEYNDFSRSQLIFSLCVRVAQALGGADSALHPETLCQGEGNPVPQYMLNQVPIGFMDSLTK
jgi:hypothetical protein